VDHPDHHVTVVDRVDDAVVADSQSAALGLGYECRGAEAQRIAFQLGQAIWVMEAPVMTPFWTV
jgi:hypothetical protein